MGLFVGNPFTGSNGWIKQPVTQEQRIKMMELEALRKRKNSNGGLDNYRDAVAKIGETEAALKGMKDQSRLGGLPPGPLPPEGDTTVVEKGAGPQPIALPQGVAMGSEQPFKQVPPDRFQEPIQDPVLTADAIRQSYGRQQQMMAQSGAAGVPTPQPRPELPVQVADATPPAPMSRNVLAGSAQSASGVNPVSTKDQSAPTRGAPAPPVNRQVLSTPSIPQAAVASFNEDDNQFLSSLGVTSLADPNATYGISATKNAQPFKGIVLHHAEGSARNLIDYQKRGDAQRGGHFGYHFYIDPDGTTYLGAPLDKRTNHVKGPGHSKRKGFNPNLSNSNAIGISLVGAENGETPEQRAALDRIMPALISRYGIDPANIAGHGELQGDRMETEGRLAAMYRGDVAPTDENWIRGGGTAIAGASPPPGSPPNQPLAFTSGAQSMNQGQSPQDALLELLMAQQGAQNYAPAPHTPMLPGSPQSELAQTAPIVAGGGNVNPISFGGDMPASPEQTDQRKALAEAMLASSQGTQDIRHPTQGLAQVARAATGAYGMHRANKQEDEYRQRLAQALIGSQNGGSADELAQLNPRMYMQIQQQRAAQEAQQAQIQRQDALRQQEWQREDALRQQEWQREDAIRQEKEAAARFGTIPTGWQTVQDGGAMRLEPIPGGPAEREMQQASEQEQLRERVKAMGGGIVSEDIGRAYDMVRESPNWRTGAAGSLLQHAPGTGAHNLSKTLQTVRANTAFDALQRMREASPTGGALGAVSERELAALESTQGALEQSQTADQLAYNLARLNDTTLDIIHGPSWRETNPELSMMGRFQQDFGKEDDGAPPKAGQVEDGYRFKGGDPSNPNNWERL